MGFNIDGEFKRVQLKYWQNRLHVIENCTAVFLNAPEVEPLIPAYEGDQYGVFLSAQKREGHDLPQWSPNQILAPIMKDALDKMVGAIKAKIAAVELLPDDVDE